VFGGVSIPPVAPDTSGWSMLAAAKRTMPAVHSKIASNSYPNDGLPRLGFAISSAVLDRDAEAILAMRRVLRDRPPGSQRSAEQ